MFGLSGQKIQWNMTLSVAYVFEFITETVSKNYMDLPKVHERFFNSRVRDSSGEIDGDKRSVWITLSVFYALIVMVSVRMGFGRILKFISSFCVSSLNIDSWE